MGRIHLIGALAIAAGCQHQARPTVPGDTGTAVASVSVAGEDGASLSVPVKPLLEGLGVRKGSLIRPERELNPYRLAEDRRRIATYLQSLGRFDATVSAPRIDRRGDAVGITWIVREGPAYTISDVAIARAPAELEAELDALIPFGPGDPVDINVYRPLRRALAGKLQERGYGHARVYSRTYVDRAAKKVIWRYTVDAGPRTTVGSISIEGARNVPAEVIRERLGIRVGDAYSTAAKKAAELSLLDTGAFRTAVVLTDADVLAGPPEFPETGGAGADRIDAHGDLIARDLDPEVDLRVVIVEAPSRQLRLEAGVEADPARLDAFAGFKTIFRNAIGPQHHITAEARAGYGWRISDPEDPTGAYGEARVRYLRPGAVGRDGDLRITGELRHRLLPTAASRELSAGPGLRRTLADNLFVDVDAVYKRSTELGLDIDGADVNDDRDDLALSAEPYSEGAELAASIVYDSRDDRVEATRGRMLAGTATWMPGGPLGTHSLVAVSADGRQLFGLSSSWSLGLRASGALIAAHGDSGVPLGARLFGGGAYGFRGLGRGELSPAAGEELVGGLSLIESSIEARWLPRRALYGAAAFVDLGGVGAGRNPLADGASAAVGLGARLRSWYVPISIDASYRLLDRDELVDPISLGAYSLFFRIGEAF
jgi:outer membrane protein assembly factor BamA